MSQAARQIPKIGDGNILPISRRQSQMTLHDAIGEIVAVTIFCQTSMRCAHSSVDGGWLPHIFQESQEFRLRESEGYIDNGHGTGMLRRDG
ncbi:MAG: hypothetical protein ABSH28_01340 [Acidobacteriota bacterium]|jgi:hypothetical protein